MNIALVTSSEEKEWYEDIGLLRKALHELGADADVVVWDDPSVQWTKYDAAVIDSTWDYTEKYDRFMEWCSTVSATCKLVNPIEVLRLSSNKRYLPILASNGISVPKSYILEDKQGLNDIVFSDSNTKVVVKPLIGADGVNTFMFSSLDVALTSEIIQNIHTGREVLLQEYISEIKTLGEIGAVFINGALSHCVLKTPNDEDFRVQYQHGGTTKLTDSPAYVQHLYNQVVAALNVKPLYMRLDFIPTSIPTIMEVEMVEPNKFFSLYPKGATLMAQAVFDFVS